MAGARKDLTTDLVPADKPLGAKYKRDFYSWLMEQARHLRKGRFHALDRDNLAEEIESLGREQFNTLVSALRVLMAHILKWDHQPPLRSRLGSLDSRTAVGDRGRAGGQSRLEAAHRRGHCPRLPARPHRSGERDGLGRG